MNLSCTSRQIYDIKNSSSSKPTTASLLVSPIEWNRQRKHMKDPYKSSKLKFLWRSWTVHALRTMTIVSTHTAFRWFWGPLQYMWAGQHLIKQIPFADVFSLSSTSSCRTSKRVKLVFLLMSPNTTCSFLPRCKLQLMLFSSLGRLS